MIALLPETRFEESLPLSHAAFKRAELDVLSRWSQVPVELPVHPSNRDVFLEKMRHRQGIKRRMLEDVWDLESEFGSGQPHAWAGNTFSFVYQRGGFNAYTLATPLYALDDPGRLEVAWTSTAQLAISCLLLAASRVRPDVSVDMLSGGYWETVAFLRTFKLQRRWSGPWIAFIDSSAWDGDLPDFGDCVGVVYDTTCMARGAPVIQSIRDVAARHDLPLFLLRSHLKLDNLGMEFGRLGSVAYQAAPGAFGAAVWRAFLDAGRWFGLFAQYTQIYPFLFDPDFCAVNDAWLARISGVHQTIRAALERTGDPSRLAFFSHDKFLCVRVGQDFDQSVQKLSKALSLMGIAHASMPSFVWDFVAFTGFIEERQLSSWRGAETVRISVGDLPRERIDDFLRAFSFWLEQTAP